MAEPSPGTELDGDLGPPERTSAWRGQVVLPAAVTTAICVIVLRAGWEQLRGHRIMFMPDIWETVLATSSAAHGAQFVGAWSRLGLFHPGPLFFYGSAPFLRASGSNPGALTLATAVLVAACVVGIVVRVGRSVDAPAATVAAFACAAAVYQLGIPGVLAPWNPTFLILPTALGIVCAADAAGRGSVWSMAAGVVAGTFVIQAHIGTVALGASILLWALFAGVWRRRRATPAGEPTLRVRQLALLGAALLLPWVPVAVDQFFRTGNAGKTAAYLIEGRAPEGSLPALGDQVSVVQAVRQVGSIAALSEPSTASWAGISLPLGRTHRPGVRSDLVFAVLVAASAVAATRRVGPDRAPPAIRVLGVWCCRIGLFCLAVQAVAAIRVRDAFRIYLVAGAAGVGLVLWLGIALVALGWARARWSTRTPEIDTAVSGIALLGGLLLVALAPARIVGFEVRADSSPVVAAIGREADGATVVLRPDHEPAIPKTLKLAWALEATGTPVAVRGPFDYRFSDQERSRSTDGGLELAVVTTDQQPPPGCRTIGVYEEATVCALTR